MRLRQSILLSVIVAATLLQWVGKFITNVSGIVFNLLPFIVFLAAILLWAFQIASGAEALERLAISAVNSPVTADVILQESLFLTVAFQVRVEILTFFVIFSNGDKCPIIYTIKDIPRFCLRDSLGFEFGHYITPLQKRESSNFLK